MATQVNTSLPTWLAGCTYDGVGANDLRNSTVAAMYYDVGIVTGSTIKVLGGVLGGAGLQVTPGTGMTVSVQPGSYAVPNSATPTAGGYTSTLPSSATLTVTAADPTNSRIDIVVAFVSDVGTSSSFGAVQILTGTPAPSPSAPGAPANSIILCQLTIPAGVTSITSGMLADVRPFTTATGGILVAPKGSVTGYRGQVAYDVPSAAFYHNNNAVGSTQLHVLPWVPVVTTQSSSLTFGGPETTVLTETFTCDGYTDVEIYFKWPGTSSNRGGAFVFNTLFRMYIDAANVDSLWTGNNICDGFTYEGGSWSYFTNPGAGDTPAAGTHTVKVTATNASGTHAMTVYGATGNKILLYVKPVSV